MNLSSVIGQLLQDGMSPASRGRLEHSTGPQGLGALDAGGGLGDILSSVLGGGASGGASAGGGLLGGLGSMLSANSGVGGLSRGQVGGIGAIAGALLGGGGGSMKGALGGGAMALLGTLAMSAMKNWQAQSGAQPGGGRSAAAPSLSDTEVQQMMAPETAELCLLGMIEAVKSDGEVSPEEIERITGKLQEGGITADEQRFVMEHMSKPPNLPGLLAAIPNREVGAQVYAAALLAISVDTPAERAFLAELARGAGLDVGTQQNLHAMVGAPALAV